jgi:hypothetical protein
MSPDCIFALFGYSGYAHVTHHFTHVAVQKEISASIADFDQTSIQEKQEVPNVAWIAIDKQRVDIPR